MSQPKPPDLIQSRTLSPDTTLTKPSTTTKRNPELRKNASDEPAQHAVDTELVLELPLRGPRVQVPDVHTRHGAKPSPRARRSPQATRSGKREARRSASPRRPGEEGKGTGGGERGEERRGSGALRRSGGGEREREKEKKGSGGSKRKRRKRRFGNGTHKSVRQTLRPSLLLYSELGAFVCFEPAGVFFLAAEFLS
jgi:hypothetical protein